MRLENKSNDSRKQNLDYHSFFLTAHFIPEENGIMYLRYSRKENVN